ncbi:MAG: hypothetical protein NWF05_07545 [Candidatus Bathyarchaeota archaeon]|nr:hypothetical protein [Candidatus Bathyarchaeota archaeon]
MNWKTVLQLVRVDMKSGRLLRGQRLIKYNVKGSRIFSYLSYVAAVAIGVVAGVIALVIYNALAAEANFQSLFEVGFANFQYSLPTLILIFTFIFSMMQQIQRSGASFKRQAPYWLPVTWQEHTLAGILADMLGLPMLSIAAIAPAVLIVSAVTGLIPSTIGAVLSMFAAAFMASAIMEIFRILQVRFTGAVYKSTGRAAIWVRFASSIMFFVVFYIIYFSMTSGANALNFVQSVASVQNALWFVPFVWLGIMLYSLANGLLLNGVVFLALSLLFIFGLFFLGTTLNKRFGLYEPPAITISRGVYVPKAGILGRFGFSSVEAALIRKDLKAFTRRRELVSAFIVPIVFLIIPVMSTLNGSGGATAGFPPQMGFAFTSLFPVGLMAMSLGNFMTGEEGQSIWRIYISPVSAKNFVKSKLAFMLFFALIILPITGTIGIIIYNPSINTIITMLLESVFVAFAVGSLSLANGIKGADFNEVPRPRMIRGEWSIINMATCAAVGLAVLLPLFPYVALLFAGMQIGVFLELYQVLILSGVIAAVLTVIFYKVAEGNAKELLTKAEV